VSPIRIRKAEPEEYGRIGDLTIAAYAALPVDHLWGGYAEEIRDVAGRTAAADVLVAVEDGADDEKAVVLGAVTLVADPTSPWLEWTEPGEVQFRLLAVDPATRGRGIGEALVRECLTRAGTRPVLIHTTQWLEAAQRLYVRLGFVRRADRDVPYEAWHDPDKDHDLPPEWTGAKFLAFSWRHSGG
jgi:ribosomal protein S18 acetylase RimI-like enzyme